MRRGAFCITFYLFCLAINAISAYPYRVQVITTKGVTFITMQGNEHMKYAITDDGYCVVQDSVGWKYLRRDTMGILSKSEFLLERKNAYSEELKYFLNSKWAVRQIENQDLSNSNYTAKSYYRAHRQEKPVVGKRKALIVMMQFADCSFTKTREDFNALFNEPGYSYDGASGSVYDYYQYASYAQLDLTCDVIGPFTSAHDMAYYGKNVGMSGNDKNPYELFKEALLQVSATVTLSDYDADKDGYIDNFHIIYAGYGEEAGAPINAIWAHESTFSPVSVGDMLIDRYSCAPELRSNHGGGISRIGPHCHEIGHALGAMDFYDTDYDVGGKYQGTGKWDVMASGSWNNEGITPANFNSYVKSYDFGWTKVVTLQEDTSVVVEPSTYNNVVFRINTPVNNDYFLLENRRLKSFDIGNPGEGLLILHVSPNLEGKTGTNSINATFPQNCYYVCASSSDMKPSSSPSSYGSINSDGCPFPGSSNNNNLTSTTTPAAICTNGMNANFSLLNIQELVEESIQLDFVAGSDSIESTTDDTDIPLTGEIVWEENFKDMSLPKGWEQINIIGDALWAKRISAKEGLVHYAELAYESSPWDTDKIVSTVLTTNMLDLTPTDYVLSYDVNRISQNDNPDTLIVSLENEEPIIKNVLSTEGWETKSCIIKIEQMPFKLCFNGIVNKSSAIGLTNIRIRKLPITDEIRSSVWDGMAKSPSVYSIFGHKLSKEQKGANIVRMPDGTYKKVINK